MAIGRHKDLVLLFILFAIATAEFFLNVDRPYATGIFVGRHSLNIDAPEWQDAIKGFPDLGVLVSRPLYPFIGSVLSKAFYFLPLLTVLRAANLVLIYLMLYLFYELVLFFTNDRRIVFAAVFLLATAPAITVYGPQPVPEILTFFSIALLTYLAAFLEKVGLSPLRVILFALLNGVVLLIKENVALVFLFFILLLWARHFRYALLYAAAVLLPYLMWVLIVRFVMRAPFMIAGVEHYGFITWLQQDFARLSLWGQIQYVARSIARFGWHLLRGFVFVPVVLSFVGLAVSRLAGKWLLYLAHGVAYFLMFFVMNLVTPRMTFMLYPVILFFAAEGWCRITIPKRGGSIFREIVFLLPLILFAILTSSDIYRLYNYG